MIRSNLQFAGRDSYIGVGLSNVGAGIGVLEGLLARVQRPRGNVDLLAEGGGVRLEEGVHVLPAVEVANTTNLGLHHRLGCIAGAITEDQTLDVSGADLAAVVDDIAGWGDHNLSGVQAGKIELGVSEGDPDLVGASCLADAAHLLGVGGERVLAVLLQKRQALLICLLYTSDAADEMD